MSFVKRLSSSIFAKVDRVVGEIENHDALIQASITDQRKKLASAKVQLARLQNHQRRVEQQLEKVLQEEKRWGERAVTAAASDEKRALACMQQRHRIGEQAAQLEQARQQYQQAAIKMEEDVNRCDSKILEMSRKHALMRSRQSSAEALGSVAQSASTRVDDLEGSFDRWEVKISQEEMEAELVSETNMDPFAANSALEQEYQSQEREDELREELAALIAKEKNDEQP